MIVKKHLGKGFLSLLAALLTDCSRYIIKKFKNYPTGASFAKKSILKTMNIFLSVYIKKRRRSGATLRIFDLCNQEKRQVVCYIYLRNDALVPILIKYQ